MSTADMLQFVQDPQEALRFQQDMAQFERKLDNIDRAIDRALEEAQSEKEREEIRAYQELVRQAREELDNPNLTAKERDALRKQWDKRLDDEMPDAVRRQRQHDETAKLDVSAKLTDAEKSQWGAQVSISAADSIAPTPIDTGLSLDTAFSMAATPAAPGTEPAQAPASPEPATLKITSFG